MDKLPVLVTTEHKGVFFGYLNSEMLKEKVQLTGARNCTYWDAELRGVFGLASHGPGAKCKIGHLIEEITLFDITSISKCTSVAVEAWDKAPWND